MKKINFFTLRAYIILIIIKVVTTRFLGNGNAICDKTTKHEGRWLYECHHFEGDLKKYEDLSIVYRDEYGSMYWRVLVTSSIKDWIANPVGTMSLDIQYRRRFL